MKDLSESPAPSCTSAPTQTIAQTMQPFVDRGLIAGAVTLAASEDTLLSLEAFGYRDLATREPMTTDSLFWIASMTKPMTATALMMLVDEGKLSVDDPVEKYLPEFKGQMVLAEKDDDHLLLKKADHPITVREILSHTSGLNFSSALETPTFDRFHLRDAVRSYAMTALLFQPGTQYSYSNAGTNTAGCLIELLSGLSYPEFMDQRLFLPLGMRDTTFWPGEEQLRRFARIYSSREDKSGLEETTLTQLSYPFHNPKRKPLPAGGLFSTATDCARFCQMILQGGVYDGRPYLSELAIAEMTCKQTGAAVEKSYGFCWDVEGTKIGHGGAYKTHMGIDRASGLITVFLIHHTNDWPHDDGKDLRARFVSAAEKLPRGKAAASAF